MKTGCHIYIIRYMLALSVCAFGLTACDVHEFPELPDTMPVRLHLHYETAMTYWNHTVSGTKVTEVSTGPTYDNTRPYGIMRYIVRAYPRNTKQRNMVGEAREFVFTRDVAERYDCELALDLPSGDYDIMVWSDLTHTNDGIPFYNADNFAEIMLQGNHTGNDDWRDAFRGTTPIMLTADGYGQAHDVEITMQRPLAKFEFLTNDLREFVDKELEYLRKNAETRGTNVPTRVDTENYKVVIYYSGFMPDTYNMNTDKPVDSANGVLFESTINQLTDDDASLGFDYVMVNGKDAGVMVQIALFDNAGRQISLTDQIEVPLRRSYHTVLKGSFLMRQASGGIVINPDFDGEHNVII